jgi:hypothetical protein
MTRQGAAGTFARLRDRDLLCSTTENRQHRQLERSVMSPTSTNAATRAYLIFTGTGPILVLSTYPSLTDERLIGKLRYKGIDKFIAYEVDLEAVKARYAHSYSNIVRDLEAEEDLRVLDFNGHQIMANFSLDELGEPIKFGG